MRLRWLRWNNNNVSRSASTVAVLDFGSIGFLASLYPLVRSSVRMFPFVVSVVFRSFRLRVVSVNSVKNVKMVTNLNIFTKKKKQQCFV